MEKKLFVGNVDFNINKEELKKIFSEFGEVTDAFIVRDKQTHRPRGFGFVTFANEEGAQKAIDNLNGKEINNRELKVVFAEPLEGEKTKSTQKSEKPKPAKEPVTEEETTEDSTETVEDADDSQIEETVEETEEDSEEETDTEEDEENKEQ